MKKRVLAALLALVMLFGALPMSVFAADNTATYAVDSENMPSTTPTLTDGSFILICKDGPHGDSGEDNQGRAAMPANGQYKVTTVEEYWDTAKQAWIYTIEVDTDAVMARFARFDSEHELLDRKVVATWQYNTTYNAWYPVSETTGYVATLHIGLKNSGSTTVDPTKVTPEFLDTASIHYVCDTCKPSSYYIDITSGMYNVTEHSETTFRIKWNDEAILKAYNDLYPGHTWDEQGNGSNSYHIDPFAMTWTWDATTQKWTRSGSPTIRAYVKSTASSGTDEPGEPSDWVKNITFKCSDKTCESSKGVGVYDQPRDTWKVERTPTTFTVSLIPGKVQEIISDLPSLNGHTIATSNAYTPKSITWNYVDGKWTRDGVNYFTVTLDHPEDTNPEETTTVNVFVKGIDFSGKDLSPSQLKSTDFGSKTVGDYYHVGSLTTTQTLTDMEQEGLENTDPVKTFVYQQMAKGAETWTPASGVEKNFTWARQILFTELKKQNDGTYNLYGQILAYELALDLQDGTLTNDMVSGYYLSGSEVTLPVPTRQNYTFLGWEKQGLSGDGDGDGDGGVITLALDEAISQPQTIEVDYNVTYVANWQENPYLTLTYNANAPEGKTVTNLPEPQKEYLQEGSTVEFQLRWAIPACEGYKFLGWTTDRNSNNPTFPVENLGTDSWVSTTGEPNYILYAVWKELPKIPTEADVKSAIGALGNLRVLCLNPKTGENNCNFCDWPYYAAGSASEPVKVNDTTYTVTVDAEKFAKVYKGNRGPNGETVDHNLYSPATLSWTLTYANGKWTAVADQPNYIFVTHAPMKWEEVKKIATGTGVDTTCVTTGKYANYGLTVPFVYYGPNTKPYHDQVISVDYDETTKSYAATFKVDTFADSIAKVCVNSQLAHKLTTKEALTWIFSVESVNGTTASWKAEPKTADDAKVTVRCLTDVNVYINPVDTEGDPLNKLGLTPLSDETLDRIGLNNYDEDKDALLAGSFQSNAALQADPDVDDVAEELLENGTFQIDPANNKANFEKNNILEQTDWTYVEPDENYMLGVLTLYSVKFETEDAENVTGVPADDYYLLTEEFKLPNPTRPGFKFLGWKADADTPVIYSDPTTDAGSLLQAGANYRVLNNVTFTAVWEAEMQTVQLVIYRNGNMTKAFKTVPLEKQPKGTVIDLTALDIANYYTANSTGKYDFYGWYNDGKWNNYKENPENPPAGLDTITVNGWTNIICMVYDHEKVVVKALYDGSTDVKNAEVLYTTTARKGLNTNEVLNGLELTLDKTGHTHDEWFNDSITYKFGENDTINGWTNAYVKYTRKEYIIASNLHINGGTANLADGKNYPWSYRYGDLYGEPINYQPMIDALKERAMAVDQDNTPVDAEIKLYFPGSSDRLFNNEILTYGQEGGGWNAGNKNTAPIWGYATTIYEVTFNSDGGSEVAAQRVKYGETLAAFDEPTKDGYKFLGWFTEAGEAFDLSSTITKSMTLTAKWEKKSYIIASNLHINGGTANLADGKNYPWSYRYGDLYGEPINYQPMIDALKERAMAVDQDNTPVDAEIKLCFPGTSDRLFNEEILTYGQDGGGWNPGNKNTAPIWGYATTIYEVTFNSDGGSAVDAQTVKYGEKLAAFDEPTKDGYKFLGWYTKADEAFDLTTPITKSMTLTAKWERNTYTIIYHGNGGVKVDGNKTHEQLTSKKLPIGEPTTLKSAEFTRDNYRFLGWSYFENGSVYFKAAEKNVLFEESDIDENGNVHLYAIWKRLSYPVTLRYNANTTDEVTNMPEPLEQTKDSDETGNAEFNISGMIPARAGYRFLGWAVNKPDAAEDDIRFKAGEPSIFVVNYQDDITLYAVWQELYTVTYSYDPSLPAEVQATIPKDPDTYTVGQKVTTAAKPNSVRVGENIWTFKTWKLDGVEVAPNTQVEMVSGGLHFEGIWETKLIHYSLTIQYVDKKGKELAESHMDLLSKGEAYKVDSPKIKGYKLKNKDDAVIEGTMPGRNLTIEVVYIKKSTGGGSGTIDSPNKPTTKAPALTLNTDDHFAFINGYPDGSVQPEGNVTRAETAAILYRIMGDACQSYYKTNSSSYSDVARGDWYNTYVATLENAGVIVDTRTNGKFRPNDAITRAELASMIAQFAGLESASAAKFNDVGSRYWAAEEIAIAAKMGWINGYPDGSFRPDRNVTRAELMAMVNRALGRTPKSAGDLLSGMKTWRDNANVNAWYYLDVQEATNDHTYTKSGTHEIWKKLL